MAATGVSVADSALADYNAFKLSSNPGKYILFKIEGGSVVVDKTSEDSNFSNFLAELRDDDCRYIVYKKTVEFDDGRSSEKLVFISWLVTLRSTTNSNLLSMFYHNFNLGSPIL